MKFFSEENKEQRAKILKKVAWGAGILFGAAMMASPHLQPAVSAVAEPLKHLALASSGHLRSVTDPQTMKSLAVPLHHVLKNASTVGSHVQHVHSMIHHVVHHPAVHESMHKVVAAIGKSHDHFARVKDAVGNHFHTIRQAVSHHPVTHSVHSAIQTVSQHVSQHIQTAHQTLTAHQQLVKNLSDDNTLRLYRDVTGDAMNDVGTLNPKDPATVHALVDAMRTNLENGGTLSVHQAEKFANGLNKALSSGQGNPWVTLSEFCKKATQAVAAKDVASLGM